MPGTAPVLLSHPTPVDTPGAAADRARLQDALGMADEVSGRSDLALELARELGAGGHPVPTPGGGATRMRWEILASVSAADLTAGRVVEAHLDALAILDEAKVCADGADSSPLSRVGAGPGSTWGVFAAEGGTDPLRVSGTADGDVLTGTKPWCSLADRLSHALVTAHGPDGRGLYAVRLRSSRIRAGEGDWVSRGLADVPSGPIVLDHAPAVPVGGPGWYLQRPGFAWGGIGVAACWFGGAVALGRTLFAQVAARGGDPIADMHLGAVDLALTRSRLTLLDAAARVDSGVLTTAERGVLTARVRAVVADAAEEVVHRIGHALGPAPLARDEDHARRVADLTLYVRQHHAEKDLAALGGDLRDGGLPW
ncbi:acyl-CoA dehydrogenase [Nakamurella sp. YIM 132087]|uniref:Acyl-CoA dehydrogenase n=1 Tax=Nakamurella alba TaxID=2665158 RepID=A0A7K1FL85_9ACTN|nr:acyl-CoA dehydrogenase family protein [Nakamurella alba]MTD14905.1 acyl-CoA dehydrogenase [Nakamurella alba]